ncbi:MAG: 4Fe-4S binding protein [Dysgonamonadaceae bacterium]|nr:4Fe-4S binding protein [Dysgonamonadaceae bacterium]
MDNRLPKQYRVLKFIRVAIAIYVLATTLVFFCDFVTLTEHSAQLTVLIQFIPAMLRGSLWIVTSLLLITLIFGRLYCSVICPMDILQDVIAWIARHTGRKNRKRLRYSFSKPKNTIRYTLLAVCIASMIAGNTILILMLDPYSNFGRIATSIARPITVYANNLVSLIARKFDNYDIYNLELHTADMYSVIFAAFVFVTVAVMAILRGRLFCNTVCPVGALLSAFSRFSPVAMFIDNTKCTSCKRCERQCKAQCINISTKTVDRSRCVTCFNCLSSCKTGAMKYGLNSQKRETQRDRRDFIITATATAVSLPMIYLYKSKLPANNKIPVLPPGAQSLMLFKERCTACHLCVTHCPQQIIKPARLGFGVDYALKPHLIFYEGAFCNYGCTVCSNVCPTGAIHPLTQDSKKTVQIGIAEFRRGRCVVYTDGTSCGACSEHCPTQAVRMVDYEDGLTVPEVNPKLCIGCGACESICPVRPLKAINVKANEVHLTALLPEDEDAIDVSRDDLDFGF